MPSLLERVADVSLPPEQLSSLERAAREWREEVVADAGGPGAVTATRRALITAATGTWIVLASLDRFLFALAAKDGLADRRRRRAFAIVADRMRVADSLTRQLQTLGLERVTPKVPTLDAYVQEKYGGPPAQS